MPVSAASIFRSASWRNQRSTSTAWAEQDAAREQLGSGFAGCSVRPRSVPPGSTIFLARALPADRPTPGQERACVGSGREVPEGLLDAGEGLVRGEGLGAQVVEGLGVAVDVGLVVDDVHAGLVL